MKKVVFIIAGVVGIFVIAVSGWIATLPKDFSAEMSIDIKASAKEISPLIHNMEIYQTWSPWGQMDPTVKTVVGEPVEGLGANASWTSEKSGNGTMLVSEIQDDFIKIDLDFGEMGGGIAEWHLDQVEDITKVTWVFRGKADSLGQKVFGAFIDTMMKKPFTLGLNNLKELAEKP